jgi:GNAT superfamily N-acetyltransferase
LSPVTTRLAAPEDAEAIARLHVAASLAAYRPIFGNDYTGGDIGERIENWRRMLLGDLTLAWMPPEKTYVAVDENDVIAGFCAVGPSRDEPPGDDGEVQMLYIGPDHWRGGIGNLLFDSGSAYLRGRGFAELILWVLEDNVRARSFYEKKGWRPDGGRKPSFSKPVLSQVRYRVRAADTALRDGGLLQRRDP